MEAKALVVVALAMVFLSLASSVGARDEEGEFGKDAPSTSTGTTVEEWCEDCDGDDLWEELGCEDVAWEIPTVGDYMVMRRAYEEVVGKEASTISPVTEDDGFAVPHRVGQAGDKGRGIFATEFIPRGTPVFSFRQTAVFPDGRTVREFLSRIPPQSGCNYLQWAYNQWNEDEGRYEQIVELDDGGMFNDAKTEDAQNIGCDPEAGKEHGDPECEKYNYAMKDIQPGEEMLHLYKAFCEGNKGATALGLGWEEEEEGDVTTEEVKVI